MRRILVLLLLAVMFATARSSVASGDGAVLSAPFDARLFDTAETRVIQAALAASGDFAGVLDGRWTAGGQTALQIWSTREFGGTPLNAHVAAAVDGFLDAVEADGWHEVVLDDLGLSAALPLTRLADPVSESSGQRRWTTDGTFTVLTQRFTRADAVAWHDAAAALSVGPPQTSQTPDRLVTAGTFGDGRSFHTRSDLIRGGWSTVFLAASPGAEGALRLAAASLHPGRPEPFDLPSGGNLTRLLSESAALEETSGNSGSGDDAAATPASFTAGMTAGPPRPLPLPWFGGTGTGFYISPRLLLTAEHVVAACTRPRLTDGTPLAPIAGDVDLDIAILATPRPSERWLGLADARLRLGQRVHAIGFPYYSIAGTSLTLTSGNVSALAGIDDDRRFFSFTAPVQPGNSGGPLLDARGRVTGLVVARLSEDYIVAATGSLPQNVNYALRHDQLADFLARNGITAEEGAIGRFDPDGGVPDGFENAIAPIVCG